MCRSPIFSNWKKRTSANSSRVPVNISLMAGAHPSVRASSVAFWRLFAFQKGDMTALEGLFAEDVVSYADGGGYVRAAGVPVSGRKHVATFITALSKYCWKGVTLDWTETNGQAAVLVLRDGVPLGITI